jgi:hypothetical protein
MMYPLHIFCHVDIVEGEVINGINHITLTLQ